MASITEVANLAKVSKMTVSRVLADKGGVSSKTRKRVLEAMQKLSYVPSPAARSMRNKDILRSTGATCFALVFGADTQLADGFFCDVTRGAEQKASEFGLCPLQIHLQDTFDESWPRIQTAFSSPNLCGCLLIGQFGEKQVKAIYKVTPNIVVVDGPAPSNIKVGSVTADYLGGCNLALEHLIECVTKRLLVLTGPKDHYFSQDIKASVQIYQDQFDDVKIVETDYTSKTAQEVVGKIYETGLIYDGIFGNDEIALGALRALADLQIDVPTQVRVMGFDDVPHAEFMNPRLTTVQINKRQLGEEAVTTLLEIIRSDGQEDTISKVARASLIVREST